MKKVSLFVDVQNIYYTVKEAYNGHFDYHAFWNRATKRRKVLKALAYAIDKGDEQQLQFQEILRTIGFDVKLKPYIQRKDGSAKGDWDVGITLDMMDLAAHSDVVVLLSGDGDFEMLIEKIQNRFKTRVEVYGVRAFTADTLIHAADKFISITKKMNLVSR